METYKHHRVRDLADNDLCEGDAFASLQHVLAIFFKALLHIFCGKTVVAVCA